MARHVHLWLGLSLGMILVLLGITGAALVFYIEVDDLIHPEIRVETAAPGPAWTSPVWDRALATGRARWPNADGTWSFEVTGKGGSIPARYYPPSNHQHHHAEREMVWFSGDGLEIVRAEPWGGYLMSWLYELHANLLAGETGRQIAGWSGFASAILLVSGAISWWPRGSWHKALAFKSHAVSIRRLRDLHKLSGLYSLLLLIVVVVTGAFLALPEVKSQILATAIKAPNPIPAPLSVATNGRQISVNHALAAASRALPEAQLAFIDVPGQGREPFRMRVQVPGDPHRRFPSSFVFVDQHSGRVLAIHDIRRGNASTIAASWIRTLHDGTVGGVAVRILFAVLGVVPAFLFITGLLRWSRRLKARRSVKDMLPVTSRS